MGAKTVVTLFLASTMHFYTKFYIITLINYLLAANSGRPPLDKHHKPVFTGFLVLLELVFNDGDAETVLFFSANVTRVKFYET